MKAADVIQDAFTENLGTDWVIVDANGRVIGRTSDEHTARVGHPDAAGYFTGQDFDQAQASAETKGGGAFDLDNSGAAGGSPKGEQSSAAIGAARKREKEAAEKAKHDELKAAEAKKAEAEKKLAAEKAKAEERKKTEAKKLAGKK